MRFAHPPSPVAVLIRYLFFFIHKFPQYPCKCLADTSIPSGWGGGFSPSLLLCLGTLPLSIPPPLSLSLSLSLAAASALLAGLTRIKTPTPDTDRKQQGDPQIQPLLIAQTSLYFFSSLSQLSPCSRGNSLEVNKTSWSGEGWCILQRDG